MTDDTVVDFGKWRQTVDNGSKMLECPACKSRVTWRWYKLAIGTYGMRFCPYCGEDLRRDA